MNKLVVVEDFSIALCHGRLVVLSIFYEVNVSQNSMKYCFGCVSHISMIACVMIIHDLESSLAPPPPHMTCLHCHNGGFHSHE